MIRLAAPFLLLTASAGAAQMPSVGVTPHALRTMNPGQLRALLFDDKAPEFVEAWVEGPTREAPFLSVDLAARPVPTVYHGLCSVEIGRTSARWEIGRQGEDSPLAMSKGNTQRFFFLTDDVPSLAKRSAASESCSKISALFRDFSSRPIQAMFLDGDKVLPTSAEVVRLGFVAVRAAAEASKRLPVGKERCTAGFSETPLACNGPADFVQTRYLRDVMALTVSFCGSAKTLCVDATIERDDGCAMPSWSGPCGEDHVVIETDIRSLADGETLDASHIKSIVIRAGSNPVI